MSDVLTLCFFPDSLLEKTPEAVANFLFNGEGLSKKSIGDYLGEKEVRSPSALIDKRRFSQRILY